MSGRTMVYSTAGRLAEPLEQRAPPCPNPRCCCSTASGSWSDRQGSRSARSRQSDVVLGDPNVSRNHAEIRPRGGSWVLTDLGSTNGSRITVSAGGSEVISQG